MVFSPSSQKKQFLIWQVSEQDGGTYQSKAKKQINKCVRFNEKSNEYYDNNNPEIYNFHYESSHCELPFMNNLNSWYNNTWIDHFDSDDNPVYKSSNTDINNSTILIDKDIDYTKDTIGSKRFNNKSIKDIYNSLIFNY